MANLDIADVFGGGAMTPFRQNLVNRPRFNPNMKPMLEPEEEIIRAPRTILLGRMLDKETGEDIGPFRLPLDDEWHEPSLLLEGAPGTGKSVALSRIFSELVFSGRSGIICDYKGQYSTMSEPNHDPSHLKILLHFGEKPRGLGNIDVWLPNHIVERNGVEFCKIQYNYSKTFTIRTEDVDAGGLLLLGGKVTEGRDYVQLLDTLLSTIKKGSREGRCNYTTDMIEDQLEDLKKELPGAKRSIGVIQMILHNLIIAGVLHDRGNSVLELIDKPVKKGMAGKVSIFNTGSAGPNDIQSKGVIANFINGLCTVLMPEFEKRKGKYINKYRPIIAIEEASVYFNKSSSDMVMNAFNILQYTMGRTLGIFRIYVYQTEAQMPKDLKESDTMPIHIKLQQYLKLTDPFGEPTGEINKPGLAIVTIKNVGFMRNQDFFVQILPPKCDIRS